MVRPDALPAGHLLKGGLFLINAAIASGGFGVTYREDKPAVQASILDLVRQGTYPAALWA